MTDDILKTAHSLRDNKEKIIELWAERARQEIRSAAEKPELVLRDAIPHFLSNLVRALSPNEPETSALEVPVSREHGQQRADQGDYSLQEVIAEYFILQRTIIEVLEVETGSPIKGTVRDRILEAIAVGIEISAAEFVDRQMAQLKQSNQALEQFAYIASHDLQEPLRGIVTHLGLIQKRLGGAIDGNLNESFTFVQQSAHRMKALMESLLVYSRLRFSEGKKPNIDLNLALKHALANLHTAIEESSAQITHDPLPSLPALRIEIERLFQNLLSNAIKFRGSSAPVIHVSARKIDGHYEFSVSDNGLGISKEQRERVFEAFTRLHNRAKYPGFGLGLAICKKVAELHEGEIWLETNPSGGTTVYFTLASESA